MDRHIAESLADAAAGRTHGPYASAEDAIKALETRFKRRANKRRS